MTNHPIDVVVAGYEDEQAAQKALEDIRQADKEKRIKLYDAAIIVKDASGKLSIKETNDAGALKGAAVGGVAGVVIGLILGPLAIPLLGGAAIGAVAAKLSDAGLPNDWLKHMGEAIHAGSAVVVASVSPESGAEIDKMVASSKANVVSRGISEQSVSLMATALQNESPRPPTA